jgi:lipid II:glycine glycyltransferase (peptidoglycan interpeptide bridge formation enzyme)
MYLELKLNKFNDTSLVEEGQIKMNKNYELDLIQPYENVYRNFSTNTKRNIKKAENNKVRIAMIDSKTFFSFFKYHFSKQFGRALKRKDYTVLLRLLSFGNYHKYFTNLYYAATSPNGKILAAAFFIKYKNKLYYLDGISSNEGRNVSAMFAIFDRVINAHTEQNLILDFEGSNIDNVARFYKGFGAIETYYPTLIINKLGILAILKR